MDRSEVRQFGGMNRSIYSSKIMGMSSVLHSPRSNSERQLHLKKSRIANIPDTRNIDLSDKLDFVVVFQTIQIQRMAQEIETLRVRVKQYERQLFNCDNYQVQIKELTERCYKLQSEKNSYRQEMFQNKQASQLIFNQLEEIKKKYISVDFTTNEKYKLEKARNEQLMLQIEKWKSRYNALDQSKAKQLETIKKMMGEQSKTHLSRETKQLLDRFDLQKQQMEELIKGLKQVNIEKQTQLKRVRFELQNKDKLCQEMEKQVDQYEEKVALLSQQNYRLSELSKSKQAQLAKSKEKLKQNEDEIVRLSQQLNTKNEQNKKINGRLQKIQETINEKQGKLSKLEKTSLNDKERLSQLDRIVFLLKQRENELQAKTKILQRKDKKISSLQQSITSLKENESSILQQIQSLKQQSKLSLQTISQLIKRIQQLSLIQQSIKKSTSTSFNSVQSNYTSYKQQINKKTDMIIAYSHQLMQEIQQNQHYIKQLEQANLSNRETIEELERDKLQHLDQIQRLKQSEDKHVLASSENQRLKIHIDRLVEEIREIKAQSAKQITMLQEGIAKLQEQKNSLLKQSEQKAQQLLNQTQTQLKQLQNNYEQNILKNLKIQLTEKDKRMNEKQNAYQIIESKVKELEREMKKRQEETRKNIQIRTAEYEKITKNYEKQLSEKKQSLDRQIKLTEEIKLKMKLLIDFQQSQVKTQIDVILARIQPMENMIKGIKTVVMQRLIKQQRAFCQNQKITQNKVSQLIDLNFSLMQRNNLLYETLISSNVNIDTKLLQPLNSAKSPIRPLQHSQQPLTSTIYTSPSTKTFPSSRSTNQNLNTSNIMGTKIKETIKGNFNNETSSSIPLEFLIKHVIVCTQLESLRQRIGDKNAKLEKMKHSLMCSNVSSNKSFVAVVNGTGRNVQNVNIQHQGDMLESNIMSCTLINKLNNPFVQSIVGTGSNNHQASFIHQSRLIEQDRTFAQEKQLNIRRVTSEEHYAVHSPDTSSVLDNSSNRQGVYTKRVGSGLGLGKNGFKSIGIKKLNIYK